jgi:hypothetical protein
MAEIFIVPLNPARKAVLDPAIITTTRPTAVVKQVMRATGMNRTTASRLTKELRADLRQKQQQQARLMLEAGAPRADVAEAVGLSLSRLGVLFAGQKFHRRRRLGD